MQTRQKVWLIAITALLLTLLFALCASAETHSGTVGSTNNINWSLDTDTGVLTLTGSGATGGFSKDNRSPWYEHRSLIQSIVVEEGVTNLGQQAFLSCTNLTRVKLPLSLTTIGMQAFSGCSSLTDVIFAEGQSALKTVGTSAFNNCTALTSISFPDGGATAFSKTAFNGCTALTTVTLGNQTASVNETTFTGCTKLAKVVFRNPNTTISCTASLFPANVIFVGSGTSTAKTYAESNGIAFCDLENFPGGECGDGLTWTFNPLTDVLTISYTGTGTGAMSTYTNETGNTPAPWYAYAAAIRKIEVGEGVTVIGKNSFNCLKAATEVTLPTTLKQIDDNAFRYCHGLTKVTFAESDVALSIDAYAFNQCKALTTITIPDNVTELQSYAFTQCGLTEIILEEGLGTIGAYAFNSCKTLTTITIPASVTTIGSTTQSNGDQSPFTNAMDAFKSITLLSGATEIKGTLPTGTTITAPAGGAVEKYAEDNGYTFVELGGTPTPDPEPDPEPEPDYSCGEKATWSFDAATGTLTIDGEGAMTDYDKTYALDPWEDLTASIKHVVINNGITHVGKYAFGKLTALESITFPTENAITLGAYCFSGCTALTEVRIPGNVALDDSNFASCSSLANVILEEGITTITARVFDNCTSLTSIVIPSTVERISWSGSVDSAFKRCSNLTSITFLNPNTIIYPTTAKVDGVVTDFSANAIPEDATIYGFAGSTAHTYAKDANHKRNFVELNPFALDRTTTFELTANALTANAGEYLPIVSLSRFALLNKNIVPFLSVDENGALYVHANGKTEALYNRDGNAIVLADNTAISIIYNDKTGVARFYVNRDIPTYGGEATLAINVPVADEAFLALTSISDELITAEGVTCNNTFTAKDTPVEFAGFQVGTKDSNLRILAGIDMLYYDSIGFEISLYVDGVLKGTVRENVTSVFSAVRANNETVTAESLGHNYLAAVEITGINRTIYPDDADVYFTVKTFATIDQEKLEGTERKIYIYNDEGTHVYTKSKRPYTGEFVPTLRFIASSDVHIADSAVSATTGAISGGAAKLNTAIQQILAYLGDAKLDALVLAGDIVNTGTDKQYENATKIFGHVSDGGILPDNTQLVITMGNHDWGNVVGMTEDEAKPFIQKFVDVFAPLDKEDPSMQDMREALTKDTVIGGYHFITINADKALTFAGDSGAKQRRAYGYDYSEATVALATQLIEAAVAEDPTKPVFVIQHVPNSDTVLGSNEYYETVDGKTARDDTSDSAVPTLFELQSKYPNLIVISGHSHAPSNDPASIHQKYFTSLNTGVLGGSSGQSRVEGEKFDDLTKTDPNVIYANGNNDDVYFIEIDQHNRVRVRVWDTATNGFIGETWLIDSFDPNAFQYTESRYTDEDIFFADDAEINITDVFATSIDLSFPTVSADSVVARVYKLVARDNAGNEVIGYVVPEYYADRTSAITTALRGLAPATEYTLEIYAINPMYSYDIMDKGAIWSEPITDSFTTQEKILVEAREGGDLINLLIDSSDAIVTNAAESGLTVVTTGRPGYDFDESIGMHTMSFDGTDSSTISINYNAISEAISTNGFILEAYVKINEVHSGDAVLIGSMQSSQFGIAASKGKLSFSIHDGIDNNYRKITAQSDYEADKYYHIVAAFDGTTNNAYLYVDNTLVGSVEMRIPEGSSDASMKLNSAENYRRVHLGADLNQGSYDTYSNCTFAIFNLYSVAADANLDIESWVNTAYNKLPTATSGN